MADVPSLQVPGPIFEIRKNPLGKRLKTFPWWFLAIILIAISAAFIIMANEHLFPISTEHIDTLSAGEISESLKEELALQDVNISAKAELFIQEPGVKWKIIDGRQTFFIEVEDGVLNLIARGEYGQAFDFIKLGLKISIQTSLIAYLLAIFFGLLAGLGRISSNVVFNNLARLYVELVRGIPMIVLIFFISLLHEKFGISAGIH